MSAFRFPLEVVRNLRSERERKTASQLAEALARAGSVDEARAVLEALDRRSRESIPRSIMDVGTAQSVSVVLEHLKQHLDRTDAQSTEAWEQVQVLARDFSEALADRQAIDRIKDKHHEEWRSREARSEQKRLDEVSNRKHAVGDAPGEPGGSSP